MKVGVPTEIKTDEYRVALTPIGVRELAEDGMTMMLVTHEISFARDVSDWVVFVDDGRIVEEGAPAEVLARPREERTKAFLASFSDSE